MSLDFSDFTNVLDEDDFEERPVPLEEFLYSKNFLGLPPLSKLQEEIVDISSQIYKEHTLRLLHGDIEGRKLWKNRCREYIYCMGKGASKDFLSTIICSRIVYQLLCLKDPAGYYGKPSGDYIDIVNVAINAQQATNVFFAGLKTRIKLCPWFQGKYNARARDIEFDKEIRVHSLNSQGEGTEGLNIMVAVLDEIDGFDEGKSTDNATKMFNTLNATVSSRFDDVGKVLLLSFTRSPDGFMMTHYNSVVAEKEVIVKKHTFKFDEDLPDGVAENEFAIEWEEDHIVAYKYPGVMAIKRATWDINPTKTIDSFKMDFYREPQVALGKFACQPSDYTDSTWFRDKEKISSCFSAPNGLSSPEGSDVEITLKPDDTKQYYIHVDLARVQDNCAVSMAHVESFKKASFDSKGEVSPFVVVDFIRYWKPDRNRPIDFSDVRNFIIAVKRKGFNIVKVTFDRWNSDLIMEHLTSIGIKNEKLSVGANHYSELALLMGQDMVRGPDVTLLVKELKKLIVDKKGKIEHIGTSTKDASDAVCGAVYNAATLTPRSSQDVEVRDIKDVIADNRARKQNIDNVIRTNEPMPDSLQNYLNEIRLF